MQTIKATIIDFVGIVLMVLSWWQLGIVTSTGGNATLMMASFGLPFAAYVLTYVYYRDVFWRAFFLSFLAAVLLAFGGMAVFIGTPF